MNNTIRINDHIREWKEGMTILDALILMNYTFKMLVVKIDGRLVPKTDYAITTIPNGADIKVIHLISGG